MKKYSVILFSIICVLLSRCKYSLFVTFNFAYVLYLIALIIMIKKFKYEKYLVLAIVLFNAHSIVSVLHGGLYYSWILYTGTRVLVMKMVFEFLALYPLVMIHREHKPLELTDTCTEVE